RKKLTNSSRGFTGCDGLPPSGLAGGFPVAGLPLRAGPDLLSPSTNVSESNSASGPIGFTVMWLNISASVSLPTACLLVRWYALLRQRQRSRCLTLKREAMNSSASNDSNSGCDGGLSSERLSTGITSPRPKSCAHVRLTKARAKYGFCGEVTQ